MKKWGYLACILLLIGGGFWAISLYPKDIFIRWSAYEIETKTSLLFTALILFLLVWNLVLGGGLWIVSFPARTVSWWRGRHAYTEQRLTGDILVALEEEDLQKADKLLQKGEKYFKNQACFAFLKYLWARRAENKIREKEALDLLGAFSGGDLFRQKQQIEKAIARQETQEAISLLEELKRQEKGGVWAYRELFPLYLEQGKLSEAEALLKHMPSPPFSAEHLKKERARLLYMRALTTPDDVLQQESFLRKAHFLDTSFPQVAVRLAHVLGNQKKEKQAEIILETTWRHTPHPDIAAAYSALHPGEMPTQRFQRLQKLTETNPSHPLSYWILGQAALNAKLWMPARDYLMHLAVKKPQLAYPLLAQLEQKQHEDWKAACQWLEKGYGSDFGAPRESRTPTSAKITDCESEMLVKISTDNALF